MICLPADSTGGFYPANNFVLFNTTNASALHLNESTRSSLKKRELFLDRVASDPLLNSLNPNSSQFNQAAKSLKQSYLTLQIIIIFVFFICFILSYLIKLQFKYHRLALNLYDYDIELGGKLFTLAHFNF